RRTRSRKAALLATDGILGGFLQATAADPTPTSSVVRTSPLEPLARCVDALSGDPRFAHHRITRPHPLICMARKDGRVVLVTLAAAWDHGRDVLRPYATRFAEGQAMLILLGRP